MSSKLDPDLRRQVVDAARDVRSNGDIICAGCGRVVTSKGYEIDHRVPEADGGAKDDPDNLQVLCTNKKGTGCHQVKTKQEATRRAALRRALERSPHQRARPFAIMGAGSVGVVHSYAMLVYGPEAAESVLTLSKAAAGLALAGLITGNVVRSLRPAAPQETKHGEAFEKETAPKVLDPAAVRDRLRDAMQEVFVRGDNGSIKVLEVKIENNELVRFVIGYAGTRFPDRDDNRRSDVLEQAATKMGGRWNIDWRTTEDYAVFTRRYEPPSMIPHPGFQIARPWHIIPISTDCSIDFLVTSHVLISGAVNAGKTSLIRSIIATLCDSARRDECEMILADPKQMELLGFHDWPGITKIVRTDEDLYNFAVELVEEMRERYRLLAEKKIPLNRHKPIIVLLDEYKIYVSRMKAYFQSGKSPAGRPGSGKSNPAIDAIDELLTLARKCGIHLILATQSPYASGFGADGMRQNLEGRIAMGRVDKDVSNMMFGRRIGADVPASAKGRATIQTGEGPIIEIQTYWVPDPADSDPHRKNTPEDWDILRRLGMTEESIERVLAAA